MGILPRDAQWKAFIHQFAGKKCIWIVEVSVKRLKSVLNVIYILI